MKIMILAIYLREDLKKNLKLKVFFSIHSIMHTKHLLFISRFLINQKKKFSENKNIRKRELISLSFYLIIEPN